MYAAISCPTIKLLNSHGLISTFSHAPHLVSSSRLILLLLLVVLLLLLLLLLPALSSVLAFPGFLSRYLLLLQVSFVENLSF